MKNKRSFENLKDKISIYNQYNKDILFKNY